MKRLQLLDYGRFLASIAVVLFHYTYSGINNGKIIVDIPKIDWLVYFTKHGHLGVQFFFMISGFVIFYSATNTVPEKFASSRFKRLYPTFWISMIFTSFFAILLAGGTNMEVQLKQIIANLTMLPYSFGFAEVDGVYWTLVLELKFYIFIFVIIFLGLVKYLKYLFIVGPYVILALYFFRAEQLEYNSFFYIYFVSGSLFAIIKNKFNWIVFMSLIVSFLLSIYKFQNDVFIFSNTLIVANSIFYSFFIILISNWGSTVHLPYSSVLGAVTYPLYLIHSHFGYMIINKFVNEEDNMYIVYFLLISLVLFISYLIHFIIDIKMNSFWSNVSYNVVFKPINYISIVNKWVINKTHTLFIR